MTFAIEPALYDSNVGGAAIENDLQLLKIDS
jgi:hypothetical protein